MGHMFGFINDDSDVLMRMKNDDGQELTFITAPAEAFPDDDIGPIVTGLDDQIVVAFNQEKIEELIDDSIEKNAEIYGEAAAAFLPISLILQKGMRAADEYLRNNSI
jgi:hypothetical protein